jgi:hypothetical protein
MQAVAERVCDQSVLKLLRAGVMQDETVRRPVTGTPQGGGGSVTAPAGAWVTGWIDSAG